MASKKDAAQNTDQGETENATSEEAEEGTARRGARGKPAATGGEGDEGSEASSGSQAGPQEGITQPQLDSQTGENVETNKASQDPGQAGKMAAAAKFESDRQSGQTSSHGQSGADATVGDGATPAFSETRPQGPIGAQSLPGRPPEFGDGRPAQPQNQTNLSPDEAGKDGPSLQEQGRTGQNDPNAATGRVIERGAPGYQLRPGDVGYAPPARIANPAGVVLTNEHLGYQPGSDASVNVHGQVPLAMPAPAPSTVNSDTSYMRPSVIDKNAATVHLAKMIGDLRTWIMDMPHEVHGEQAVVVQFFRDLAARRAALGTAAQLGRTVEPDQVEKASATPPPEFFTLRHAAAQILQMKAIYEAALNSAGVEIAGQDKATIDQITGEFAHLADGPQDPKEVPGAEDETEKSRAA